MLRLVANFSTGHFEPKVHLFILHFNHITYLQFISVLFNFLFEHATPWKVFTNLSYSPWRYTQSIDIFFNSKLTLLPQVRMCWNKSKSRTRKSEKFIHVVACLTFSVNWKFAMGHNAKRKHYLLLNEWFHYFKEKIFLIYFVNYE